MQICSDREEILEDIVQPWHEKTTIAFRSGVQKASHLRALSIAITSFSINTLTRHVYFAIIPPTLEALHVDIEYITSDLFSQLCDAVSNLQNLTTFSMVGQSLSFSDNDGTQFSADLILRISPPASLKRLLIEISIYSRQIQKWFGWLLAPPEGYSTDELRIRLKADYDFDFSSEKNLLHRSLLYLDVAVTKLKIFEVRIFAITYMNSFACFPCFESLLEKCTLLEELNANVLDDYLQLPKTLRRLYAFKTYHSFVHTNDDAKRLRLLTRLLEGPHLQSVFAAFHGLPRNLLKSEEVCKKAGVEFIGSSVGDGASYAWSHKSES